MSEKKREWDSEKGNNLKQGSETGRRWRNFVLFINNMVQKPLIDDKRGLNFPEGLHFTFTALTRLTLFIS